MNSPSPDEGPSCHNEGRPPSIERIRQISAYPLPIFAKEKGVGNGQRNDRDNDPHEFHSFTIVEQMLRVILTPQGWKVGEADWGWWERFDFCSLCFPLIHIRGSGQTPAAHLQFP